MRLVLTLIGPPAGDLLKSAGVVGGRRGTWVRTRRSGSRAARRRRAGARSRRSRAREPVADEGVAGLLWAAMVAKGARECGTESVERVSKGQGARVMVGAVRAKGSLLFKPS